MGQTTPEPVPPSQGSRIAAVAGSIGIASAIALLIAVQRLQFNVVTYRTEHVPRDGSVVPMLFAGALLAAMVVLAAVTAYRGSGTRRISMALSLLWPLLLTLPLAAATYSSPSPPFALTLGFILCAAWAMFRVGSHWTDPRSTPAPAVGRGGPARATRTVAPLAVLLLAILALVLVHTRAQLNFFEHFMLGHADIGHYTEELKNALAGRGLRCDSFPNTRLGWHFVPLMYVLVPGYALWPSPAYLMVVGAVLVHLPAIPAYFLAKRLSGSAIVGMLPAFAWLLLPSPGRLVYANTYGFQWDFANRKKNI